MSAYEPPGLAIVGMACRYPDAGLPSELWEMVLNQRTAFRRLPQERMDCDDYYDPDPTAVDKTYSLYAAVLEGWTFDRSAFRIPGPVFRAGDPAHWLALETAARALADAGFPGGRGLARDRVAVILGNTLTGDATRAGTLRLRWPYVRRVLGAALEDAAVPGGVREQVLGRAAARYLAPFPPTTEESLAGALSNTIAGRICNHFDFHGGGYTVDGACASSLLAVVELCRALRDRSVDFGLAGGVDLSLDPFELVGFAKAGALATERMRVYDEHSAGFWPGEGCGMLALMRAADAHAAGLRVYAEIRGWGISSDGAGGITRPDAEGQLLALRRAYEVAGVDPGEVLFHEGHGTGTQVGDATELNALTALRNNARRPAALGTIKSNIGHTKAASGAAGLIKAAMSLYTGVLPPTTGCRTPHPVLRSRRAPLRILRRSEPWPEGNRLAGVSSMGFGGINAHLVLSAPSAPEPARAPTVRSAAAPVRGPAPDHAVIAAAGTDPARLSALFERVAELALRLSFAEMHDMAAQFARGRARGPVRAAVVAATPDELAARAATAARRLRANATTGGLTRSPGVWVGCGVQGRVTLLFPGQGAPDTAASRRTETAQPAIHRASLSGLRTLQALGVTASAAVGHSLGEITALVWAGSLSVRDSIRLVRARGRLMASLGTSGTGMISLRTDPAAALELCGATELVLAAYNGPRSVVLAGRVRDLHEVAARADRAGITHLLLPVSHGFHSPAVLPCVPQLRRELAGVDIGRPTGRLVSTVYGRELAPDDDLITLLADQVTAPVRFWEAISTVMSDTDLFCACGPGQGLASLLADQGCSTPVVTVGTGDPDAACTADAASALFAAGACERLDALTTQCGSRPIDIWRDPTFLTSPCSAPDLPRASGNAGAPDAVDPPAAPVRAAPDISTAVRDLLARATELEPALIGMETRLLSDLHLTSLTVTQLAATAALGMGRRPPAAPLSLADARVSDLVDALDALPATEEAARETVVSGVDTWVHCFTERLDRARDTLPRPSAGWRTTVLGDGDGELATRAKDVFKATGEDTDLLYVPKAPHPPPIALLLATAHSAVRSGRLVVVAHDSALAGFWCSLSKEHPHLGITLLRVPATPAGLRHGTAWAGAEPGQYRELVVDDHGVPHLPVSAALRLPEPSGRPLPLAPGDVLLVSGGGKGIGHTCAKALALSCGARLALLGRTRPEHDETLRTHLAALAEAGVRAAYEPADLTDAAAVARAVRCLTERLGPVTGVLHAGGINEPTRFTDLDDTRVEAHIAPKVTGLRNILAALPTDRLRLLVSFGSVIGRHGLPGESHYALANGLLRAEIERLATELPYCRVLNVDWSVWGGVGMGVRLGVLDSLLREDVTPIAPDDGVDLFMRLLAADTLTPPTVTAHGRLGHDMPVTAVPGPPQRFLEDVRIHYPGVELVAEARLDLHIDPYLTDHRLDGTPWFPGVLGLEALAQAASAVAGQPLYEAQDIAWWHPVTVPETAVRILRVCALHRGDRVEAVLRSDENDFCVDHFRAVFPLSEPSVNGHRPPPPTGGDVLHADDLYGPLYFHTGRFRRVENLSAPNARSCRATLTAGPTDPWFTVPFAQPLLGDPSANDATLHALQACVPHRRLLPVAAASLIIRPGSGPVERVRGSERQAADGEYTWDVEGLDAGGSPVVQWRGLRLKDVGPLLRGEHEWPAALLAIHIERATAALGLNGGLAVTVRSGERSVPPRRPRSNLSRSHTGKLVLQVESTNSYRVTCDWETVTACTEERWRHILSTEHLALTDLLHRRSQEPFEVSATRVWTALECLAKTGRPPGAPLSLSGIYDGGWMLLRTGDTLIASTVVRVAHVAQQVAVAVLSAPDVNR